MVETRNELAGLSDRYSIINKLGEGAYGSVFRAKDLVLGREVAIKVLRTNGDPSMVARFQIEARATSRLQQPNLATVLDFGVDSENKPYLVMDYLKGESLSSILKKIRIIAPEVAIEIAIQICDALDHAHSRGVLHRDLKPGNTLVETREGLLHVFLVDFGLAKITNQALTITKPGVAVGTTYYISPEVISGHQADERSDLYSLGYMLFQCLTGRPPFNGDSQQETLMMHCSKPAPRLSQAAKEKDWPLELEELIQRCLEKDPELRVQSALELKEALQSILALFKSEAVPVASVHYVDPASVFGKALTGRADENSAQSGPKFLSSLITWWALILFFVVAGVFLPSWILPSQWNHDKADTQAPGENPDRSIERASVTDVTDVSDASALQILETARNGDVNFEKVTLSPRVWKAISEMKTLKKLSFTRCGGVDDSDYQHLLKKKDLILQLRDQNITDYSMSKLALLPYLRALAVVHNRDVTNAGLKHFENHSHLQRIDLSSTSVNIEGIQEFLKNKPPTLRVIKICDLNLLDEDIETIDLYGIQALDLSHNTQLTDNAVRYISENSNLVYLHLNGCRLITSTVFRLLKPHAKMIKRLGLASTDISDLKGLDHFTALKYFNLADCKNLSDESLSHIGSLTNLEKLDLSATNVSYKGLDKIATSRIAHHVSRSLFIGITNCERAKLTASEDFFLARAGIFVERQPSGESNDD